MGNGERIEGHLFEIRGGKGRRWLYMWSMMLGLLLMWAYRASHVPAVQEKGRWAWFAVSAAELWFGFYWFLTLSVRWNPVYRSPFRNKLQQRFGDELPYVDIFICTAVPIIEPPSMVIDTILSVLAYHYSPEKLSIYLSDDGCSILTFYALHEALHFARSWIPFRKKFKVLSMSPATFFSKPFVTLHTEWIAMEKLYKDMKNRIEAVVKLGEIPEEIKVQQEGFIEWSSTTTTNDHQAIVKILNKGGDAHDIDEEFQLPTVVYMAREKRPKYKHNFKAGALNALLRVSEEISNGSVVLTLDCDMHANDAGSIMDALCFFLDEERGHEFAFVQFPQAFQDLSRDDLYASSLRIIHEVDFPGLDGQGGPLYTGSCCFLRRDCLTGMKYSKLNKIELMRQRPTIQGARTSDFEERAKHLASCTFEENTQWGKEIGLKYGCPVEDVITGFSIQCRGWKSVYFNPEPKAFLGLAPTTLSQALLQHKRWSEGVLQIFLSKYCPFLYGHGRTKLGLQMGYNLHCLWAVKSIPTLIYVSIPSVCLLNGIPLFPSLSSLWFLPFASVIAISNLVSLLESLTHGDTIQGWWNEQRMRLYRTTSYLFALVDTIVKLLGISSSAFVITPKVADPETYARYERGEMEFGEASPMFTILCTVAMLNLFCVLGGIKGVMMDDGVGSLSSLFLQFLLCGSLVFVNFPIYQASFFRNDKGCIKARTTLFSVTLAALACCMQSSAC